MCRAAWLALIASTVACGARGGLDVGGRSELERHDAGARDASSAEGCDVLRALGEPMLVFDARAEGAHVVARAGGFDVASFVIEEPTPSYHVRRVVIERDRGVLGREAVLGPEARSVGTLAARDERLALCYGGSDLEGPTRVVRTDDVEYARIAGATVGSEGGDHCVALAPFRDRWLVGWQDRARRSAWAVSAMDDDGRLIGELVSLDAPPLDATAFGAGAAYAHRLPSDRLAVRVAFRAFEGTERGVLVVPAVPVDSFAMVPSPFAAAALEVAWSDVERSVMSARVFVDGAIDDVHTLGSFPEILSAPAMAPVGDGALIAIAACDRPLEGPGSIAIHRRDRVGSAEVLRLARPVCPIRPALAALDGHAALAWEEGERTMVVALACSR